MCGFNSSGSTPSFMQLYRYNYDKAVNGDFLLYNTVNTQLLKFSKLSTAALAWSPIFYSYQRYIGASPLTSTFVSATLLSAASVIASKALLFSLPHIAGFGRAFLQYTQILPIDSKVSQGLQKEFIKQIERIRDLREEETLNHFYPTASYFLASKEFYASMEAAHIPSLLGPLTLLSDRKILSLDVAYFSADSLRQLSFCLGLARLYTRSVDALVALSSVVELEN